MSSLPRVKFRKCSSIQANKSILALKEDRQARDQVSVLFGKHYSIPILLVVVVRILIKELACGWCFTLSLFWISPLHMVELGKPCSAVNSRAVSDHSLHIHNHALVAYIFLSASYNCHVCLREASSASSGDGSEVPFSGIALLLLYN